MHKINFCQSYDLEKKFKKITQKDPLNLKKTIKSIKYESTQLLSEL